MASIDLTMMTSFVCVICASAWPRKHVINRIYAWILPWLGRQVSKTFGNHHPVRVARICFDIIICLSDQQMVTFIALLIAAIKRLHVDKTISVYHLDFVINLVALSYSAYEFANHARRSVINLAEAHGKRDAESAFCWTAEPQPWYERLRDWMPWGLRMILSYTFDALLLYIIWVGARPTRYVDPRCPALCVLESSPIGGKGRTEMIVNYILIIPTDITETTCFFPAVETWWALHLRPRLVDDRSLPIHYRSHETPQGRRQSSEQSLSPKTQTTQLGGFRLILHRLRKSLKFVFATGQILFCSNFVTLASLIVWCVFYFRQTFHTIAWGRSKMEEQEQEVERAMGFGQIVPVFLLILLVLQFCDSLWGKSLVPNQTFLTSTASVAIFH